MAPRGGGLPDFTSCGTNYLHTPLLKKYPKSKSLDSNCMFFGFNAPKIGGVLMKTFSKPSFTHFFQKWPPGGGGYQISPDVALTTCIHLWSKSTQRANLWTLLALFFGYSAPKIGGVLMKTFSKPSFTHFFKTMAPAGGGVYQISPAVALTTCIHLYSKSTQVVNFWTLTACFLDSAPRK